MTDQTTEARSHEPTAEPLALRLNDQLGQASEARKPCTCDGAGRGPGRACVVKAGGRLGELWRCAADDPARSNKGPMATDPASVRRELMALARRDAITDRDRLLIGAAIGLIREA